MFSTVFRVLSGFILACFAAGLTAVLFAVGTSDILSGDPERMTKILELIALTATHFAVFAAPFALLSAAISEWQGVRSSFYHAFAGLGIATAGFTAQYFSETPGMASVASQYPLMAYAVTGLVAGLVYWIFTGRRSGGPHGDIYHPVTATLAGYGPVPNMRPRILVPTPAKND